MSTTAKNENTTSFLEWFNDNFVDELAALEEQRSEIWSDFKSDMIKYGGVGLVLGLGAGFINQPWWAFLLGGVVLGLGISIYNNIGPTKDFKQAYKKAIVSPAVQYLTDTYEYYPGSYLSENEVFGSKLIQERVDRIEGSDYVEGVVNKNEFYFSEIKLKKRKRSSKNNSSDYSTVFSGLFFVSQLSASVQAASVLYPDKSWDIFSINLSGDKEENMNRIKNTMYNLTFPSWSSSAANLAGPITELSISNSDISESYHLYSTNKQGTDALFSGEVWNLISNYLQPTDDQMWVDLGQKIRERFGDTDQEEHKNNIRIPRLCLSVIDSKVYIAQPLGTDLFEPSIWKTNIDVAELIEYFRFLKFAVDLTAAIEGKTASNS